MLANPSSFFFPSIHLQRLPTHINIGYVPALLLDTLHSNFQADNHTAPIAMKLVLVLSLVIASSADPNVILRDDIKAKDGKAMLSRDTDSSIVNIKHDGDHVSSKLRGAKHLPFLADAVACSGIGSRCR